MAVAALINEYLALNAAAMTDHVRQATLAMEASALDATAMGDGWVKNVMGLKSGSLQVEFNDDTAVSQVDSLLWALFGTNTTFEVRLDAGAVSATNPKYTGLVSIAQHNVGGSLNEVARKSLTFPTSGTVTRAIV